MLVELVLGAQKLQVHEEVGIHSDMLYDPQVLPTRQSSGMLYCMQIGENRNFYLKAETDLQVATVFSSRFNDYQQELAQAAINAGFTLSKEQDLFLPSDLFKYIHEIEILDYESNVQIFSMQDARSVIASLKIPVNSD